MNHKIKIRVNAADLVHKEIKIMATRKTNPNRLGVLGCLAIIMVLAVVRESQDSTRRRRL